MRRVVGNLVALFVTLAVSLVIGEVLLRPRVILPLRRVYPEVRYVAHSVRRFTLLPGQQAFTYGAPVTIDERGFRKNSLEASNRRRVVFALGDSFTFGMGVPNEETWPARLEKRLSERMGQAVGVVNGGTISYGVFQELDLFRSVGLSTQPAVVVHGLYWNDFMNPEPPPPGSPGVVRPDGYLSWDQPADSRNPARRAVSWVVSHSALLFSIQQAARQISQSGLEKGRFVRRGGPIYAEAYDAFLEHGLTAEEWKPIDSFYREMKALASQHRFTLFVVILPVNDIIKRSRPGLHAYPIEARRRLTELGVPYLDAFTLWETAGLNESLFLPQGPDAHLSPEGLRVIAHAIADELLARPQIAAALRAVH